MLGFSYVELEGDEQFKAERKKRHALLYLASTDWYVIRFTETGAAIPEEVVEGRKLARSYV